ncbi:MAG: hypothetical protein U0X93_08885 [Anaerolineales bacterium]
MVKKVYKVFFTPNKYGVKPSEAEILKSGNNFKVKLRWASWLSPLGAMNPTPKVLLMHGWGARANDRF